MRSLWLRDLNRMTLAEFLVFEENDAPGQYARVIGMPNMGMLFRVQADHSWPGSLSGPTRWDRPGFLHYLANIASVPADDDRLKEVIGGRTEPDTILRREMKATDLAAATGFDVEEVKTVLANHLTFREEPADA